jgi:YgiT-type zinc finger domain-containing protein
MSDQEKETFQCKECQAGVMHLHYLTYFTWLDDELVTVPNFPAWVCDVCGRREYDSRAISWLVTILSPETGKSSIGKRPVRPQARKRNATRPTLE